MSKPFAIGEGLRGSVVRVWEKPQETSWYTPGPWVLQETCSSFEIKGEFKLSKNSFITCHQWSDGNYGSTRKQAEANAHLIAAAPELLEALDQQYAWFSDVHNEWAGRNTQEGQRRLCKLRNLIAKARGISEQEAQDGVFERVAEDAGGAA